MNYIDSILSGKLKLDSSVFKKYAEQQKITLISEFGGFKVGDKVTFINSYNVKFNNLTIIGIDENEFQGRRFYLNKDSFWFPVAPENLIKE